LLEANERSHACLGRSNSFAYLFQHLKQLVRAAKWPVPRRSIKVCAVSEANEVAPDACRDDMRNLFCHIMILCL